MCIFSCLSFLLNNFVIDYFRAENGPGGYVVESIPNEDNKCRIIWLINPNLNVKIPKFILDKELVKMMLVFASDLKQHLDGKGGSLCVI